MGKCVSSRVGQEGFQLLAYTNGQLSGLDDHSLIFQ